MQCRLARVMLEQLSQRQLALQWVKPTMSAADWPIVGTITTLLFKQTIINNHTILIINPYTLTRARLSTPQFWMLCTRHRPSRQARTHQYHPSLCLPSSTSLRVRRILQLFSRGPSSSTSVEAQTDLDLFENS